jgi:hypothetical protein
VRSCGLCGELAGLEVHHVDWHHDNDVPANRLLLCRRCHVEVHRVGYLSQAELQEIRKLVVGRRS